MTPLGMSSVVKHFLSESGTHTHTSCRAVGRTTNINCSCFLSVSLSGADLFFERHVTGLYRRGASWEVQRKAGDSEEFDAVVLTMPVPQILQLQGDVGQSETCSHYTLVPHGGACSVLRSRDGGVQPDVVTRCYHKVAAAAIIFVCSFFLSVEAVRSRCSSSRPPAPPADTETFPNHPETNSPVCPRSDPGSPPGVSPRV